MIETPFIAHSELTNEIYIVVGKEKYRVTEQAIKAVKAIKALEQEPTTKNNLGVDTDKLISDCEKMSFDIDFFNKPLKVVALDAVKNIVNDLPSVTPIRPKGQWIDHSDDGYVECPKCGSATNCDGNIADLHFCFSCGADMREVEK